MLYVLTGPKATDKAIDRYVAKALRSFPEKPPTVAGHTLPLEDARAGDVIICMGEDAKGAFAGLFPKNRALSGLRRTPFLAPSGATVLVAPAVESCDVLPGTDSEIRWDLRFACRVHNTGAVDPVLGNYRWVSDFTDIVAKAHAAIEAGQSPVLSLDTETVGLVPYGRPDFFVCFQLSLAAGEADCWYAADAPPEAVALVRKQLAWLLNHPRIRTRGANLKFDLVGLSVVWGITCSNFSMDTVLVGSILDENRSNSLKNHCWEYAPELAGYDAALPPGAIEKMGEVPKDTLLNYAGPDADAVHRVSAPMIKTLADDANLLRFYQTVLHPAARAFEKIEANGMCIDTVALKAFGSELEAEIAQSDETLLSLIPARLKLKYADNLKLTRPALLVDLFFSPAGFNLKPRQWTTTGKPSTARGHLRRFADHPEAGAFIKTLEGRTGAAKTLSTYVVGFLKHVRPDGRFHPTFMLHAGAFDDFDDDDGGTVTGRLAATNPAVQTIPKRTKWAKRLRKCFPAPPGYVIGGNDYRQGELKIIACRANDPTMLAAYSADKDLHTITAASLLGVTFEEVLALETTDPLKYVQVRTSAKSANFGLVYGMSAEGFQAYAFIAFGLVLSLAEAEKIRDTFFGTYKGLTPWHENEVSFARRWGFVRSFLGRVRHLPHIWSPDGFTASKARRQAINAPIQGDLSDMLLMVIGIVSEKYPWINMIAAIHDQLVWTAPESRAEEAAATVAHVMETLPLHTFGWHPQLKFTADAEIGPNLGEMQQVKLKG